MRHKKSNTQYTYNFYVTYKQKLILKLIMCEPIWIGLIFVKEMGSYNINKNI